MNNRHLFFVFSVGISFCLCIANSSIVQATENTDSHQITKNANINEAEKLNTASIEQGSQNTSQKNAQDTADVVNQVPGVKVNASDLQPPELPPIKGFHPIKKLLRPVENLEGMSIKLEQQIMRLEGPIAALQPPMLKLDKKMTTVDDNISKMQTRLVSMENEVKGTRQDISGTRAEIAKVRDEIAQLRAPITDLRGPIGSVAKPLEALQMQLNFILMAILLTAVIIAVGTPIVAIQVYRNRHKIFPDLHEHELPKEVAPSRIAR